MPQYAIFIYSDPTAEHDDAELAEHEKHSDDLIAAGALTAAYALSEPAAATSIRGSGETDGPYTETKEFIAGVGIVEADDREAALVLARQNPAIRHSAGVEVREIVGAYTRADGGSGEGVTAVTAG
ncbi:YciI family protein [Leifsonia sp. NPDC077715]|uniref:YciI family protein n=1 Tax=Leifsonia sp. NPDC077715 TaxID=3155539 RepID=UPI003417AA56